MSLLLRHTWRIRVLAESPHIRTAAAIHRPIHLHLCATYWAAKNLPPAVFVPPGNYDRSAQLLVVVVHQLRQTCSLLYCSCFSTFLLDLIEYESNVVTDLLGVWGVAGP